MDDNGSNGRWRYTAFRQKELKGEKPVKDFEEQIKDSVRRPKGVVHNPEGSSDTSDTRDRERARETTTHTDTQFTEF